ncbi:hypothetical protein HGRIS_001370 [Hohenbuehelia grisea]|uniref:Uncharacterized protein n=1 Tax=Hohenbuehelia grisea TaxID=104357 RepID=A0ABR3JPB3_9AGAR
MDDINAFSGSGISTFISHQAPHSADIRTAIKAELSGRVTVDSTQILRRLNTEAIEPELVDNVLQGFGERNSVPISVLQTLAKSKKADEKAMYPHLDGSMIRERLTIAEYYLAKYPRRYHQLWIRHIFATILQHTQPCRQR